MRSLLQVPLLDENRIDEALSSKADAICLDWASVGEQPDQSKALGLVKYALARRSAQETTARVFLRIHPMPSLKVDRDLDALIPFRPDGLFLPECETERSIKALSVRLEAQEAIVGLAKASIKIIASVADTPASVFGLQGYDAESDRLVAMTWNAQKLADDLNLRQSETHRSTMLSSPIQLARSLCVLAASSAGVPALDTILDNPADETGFERETSTALRDGFSGKMATHPKQVPIINKIFADRHNGQKSEF
ncbi:aldolase/citrate lyase family protein [uncultured Cohaesibacter sp.]|uniref:HpcH/HpaI aldolase/citrate lyase family protein n=1 Tax=uncultured Cohaesibacter sp. TaxID=1002546 RepID=UPI00292EBEB2|nr:aldolase/citrate lyase family protein [uncultured Cohaesibacter sp.]